MDLKKTISRSYTRKLNLARYGGAQYESMDFFASYSEEVAADASKETIKRTSQLLYDSAIADVEEAVDETKKELAQLRLEKTKKERSEEYKRDELNNL